jgi:hypothetical protein
MRRAAAWGEGAPQAERLERGEGPPRLKKMRRAAAVRERRR